MTTEKLYFNINESDIIFVTWKGSFSKDTINQDNNIRKHALFL